MVVINTGENPPAFSIDPYCDGDGSIQISNSIIIPDNTLKVCYG